MGGNQKSRNHKKDIYADVATRDSKVGVKQQHSNHRQCAEAIDLSTIVSRIIHPVIFKMIERP